MGARGKAEQCFDEVRKPGRTLRAAVAASREGGAVIIKPREIIEIAFRSGCRPSLAARRTLVILFASAGAAAADNLVHRVDRRGLPRGHHADEELDALCDELSSIRLKLLTVSGRNRPAIEHTGLFAFIRREIDADNRAWIEWRFSDGTREVFETSDVFARLSRAAILNFRSSYALTLYEWGTLLVGREWPAWSGDLPQLRAILGCGEKTPWADMRRHILEPATRELAAAGLGMLVKISARRRKAVVSVTIVFSVRRQAVQHKAVAIKTAPTSPAVRWLSSLPEAEQKSLYQLHQQGQNGYRTFPDPRWKEDAWEAEGYPAPRVR